MNVLGERAETHPALQTPEAAGPDRQWCSFHVSTHSDATCRMQVKDKAQAKVLGTRPPRRHLLYDYIYSVRAGISLL